MKGVSPKCSLGSIYSDRPRAVMAGELWVLSNVDAYEKNLTPDLSV